MDINSYLVPGKRAHLAGIGGVSMSPLAEVLHSMGLSVQGSDMNDSPAVEHLRALGIPVAIGHAADNLGEADFVVRTAAIHDDNPEISGAVTRGIPVFERAQAWGAIMHGYRNALCISGTHGKTTTTSMATHIFMAADADPMITDPLAALCEATAIPVEGDKTLRELGRATGIAVGAAAVAEVR